MLVVAGKMTTPEKTMEYTKGSRHFLITTAFYQIPRSGSLKKVLPSGKAISDDVTSGVHCHLETPHAFQ